MKKVRIQYEGRPIWGELKDGVITLENGHTLSAQDADYLAPVEPSKIIGVHLNYPCRLKAMIDKGVLAGPPRWASYFLKSPSALTGTGKPVPRPQGTHHLNYEGEIAIIVGKRAERVKRQDALSYIAGISAANDFVLHDFQSSDRGSMLRAKGQKGFCPIGDCMVTADEVDFDNIKLRTYVNGTQVQEGCSADLVFPFDYLIADLSRLITLEVGDVILTGSPTNSRPVEPGDVVTVELAGYCRLENTITEYCVDWGDFGAQPEGEGYATKG